MNNRWPNEDSERRVRVALNAPGGEVLRIIAAQPRRGSAMKHLVNPDMVIPVPR